MTTENKFIDFNQKKYFLQIFEKFAFLHRAIFPQFRDKQPRTAQTFLGGI